MSASSDRLLGQKLGSYELVEAIGQGGMARVYKGYHADLNRYAAIKVIVWGLSEDQEYTTRFRREAQAIAALRHPNIVTIYDFGGYDNGYFLAMEYIEGSDLEAVIARGERLPPQKIRAILSDIAGALDYTHSHNVIHRDIKPSNIMLTQDDQAILTDFGLVMLPNTIGNTTLGTSFGTPYYMAPEQATSSAAAVPGSDIYSLGAILFELITGTPPYVSDSPLGVALKHVSDPIPNVQDFAPETPDAVRVVVERALAKAPEDRFASASDMVVALEQAWHNTKAVPTAIIQPPALPNLPLPAASISQIQPPPLPLTPSEPPESTVTTVTPPPARTRLLWGMLIISLLIILTIGVGLNLRSSSESGQVSAAQLSQSTSEAPVNEINETTDKASDDASNDVSNDVSDANSDEASTITSTVPAITHNQAVTSTDTPLLVPASPTSSPTVSQPATPTETGTPTPTVTATPTITVSATPSLVPVPQPTNTPTTEEILAGLHGKILFKTERSGRVEIYTMNPDGTGQEPLGPELAYLYNEAIRWEAYSPDKGETIAVRGQGQVDLWYVNLETPRETQITNDPTNDYDPVWSPIQNDDRIVFVSERTGRGDLYILDLNGSGVRRLTNNEGDFDKHPSWSPDGTKIVYWSDQGWQKNPQIWLLDLETNEQISLSNNPYKDWDPVWIK